MKKFSVIVLAILIISVFILRRGPETTAAISALAKKGIAAGGTLKYRIYLLGILPAAEATFTREAVEDYNGRKVYHLHAQAASFKFLSAFFKGSTVFDSYIDMQQLTPVLFKEKIFISGKPEINRQIIYDQLEEFMLSGGVKRQIFADTQDPLSLIFNLRRMDFAAAREFEFNINTNEKNYILKGRARPAEVTVNKRSYKLAFLKSEISRREKNNPYHRSSVDIVMLSGYDNLPVLIKVFAGGFYLTVKLVGIE